LGFLGQVADLDIRLRPRLTQYLGIDARHDLEQGRLSGTIQTQHANLGAWKKRQGDVFQNFFLWRDDLSHPIHGVDVLRQGKTPMVWLKRGIP